MLGTEKGLIGLGNRALRVLPPAFVSLLLINTIFIGSVLWFLNSQMDQRTAVIGQVINRCMAQAGETEALTARLDALEHDVRTLETERRK